MTYRTADYPARTADYPPWLHRPYKYISLEWVPEIRLLRLRTKVTPIQCYSLTAMAELNQVFHDMAAVPGEVQHYVMTSDVAGVFNFGGDLSLFVLLIRARDIDSLRLYARRCVDLVWWMETAADRGIHTTVLVQGDTLGGGLESVMPFHKVIFERSAQAGFPEVLFNLFPGMGAWNFTIRKAGFDVANEMILSGKLYSADELYRKGLVDMVVDDGHGEDAMARVVASVHPRLRGTLSALRARNRAYPITLEGLLEIVEQWTQAALELTDRDLKLMERLARAQVRKVGGAEHGAVHEIKLMELDTAWDEQRSGITEWSSL
jgi:DSF synthase